MMPLKKMQEDFKDAALSGDTDSFLEENFPYDNQESTDRFSVYQNNITNNLVDVLSSTYSICEILVGKEFFQQSARAFIRENLPQDPALYLYGKGFVPYFDTLGQHHNYTYWGEVAAFEWVEQECFFEKGGKALSLQDLPPLEEVEFSKLVITLGAHVKLLKTKHNIQDIVSFSKEKSLENTHGRSSDFDIVASEEHYLFYRTTQKVFTDKVTPLAFEALHLLKAPTSLESLVLFFTQHNAATQFAPFIQLLFEKELVSADLSLNSQFKKVPVYERATDDDPLSFRSE